VIEQTPPEQLGEPLTMLQALAQPPQCAALVSVLVSQPLMSAPSQFPHGGVHDWTLQLPVAQLVVALGRLQVRPQPPQFEVVFMFVSQPSA
jgi:hypothetical protein